MKKASRVARNILGIVGSLCCKGGGFLSLWHTLCRKGVGFLRVTLASASCASHLADVCTPSRVFAAVGWAMLKLQGIPENQEGGADSLTVSDSARISGRGRLEADSGFGVL